MYLCTQGSKYICQLHIWYDSEDVSGLKLNTHLLCLQKCLTVSHRLGEREASTKITMKVSSVYCLLLSFYVSDVWSISLVRCNLCDPEPRDLSSCWNFSIRDGWYSSQQHWNDSPRGSESMNESCVAAPHIQFCVEHQQLADAPHNTSFYSWEAAQLYCFACSLDLWFAHWPSCPTLYLLLHLHPSKVAFLSIFHFRLLLWQRSSAVLWWYLCGPWKIRRWDW